MSPLAARFDPGDTLNGAEVLPNGPGFRLLLPAVKGGVVLLTVAPAAPNPASAPSQVKWRAMDATLGNLATLASATTVRS